MDKLVILIWNLDMDKLVILKNLDMILKNHDMILMNNNH